MYYVVLKDRFKHSKEIIDEENVGLFDQRHMATHGMNRNLQRDIPFFFDNLKVVQRRLLYTMAQMGLKPKGGMSKSAGAVGETLAKYHPHSDDAAWKALVYLRQPWRHLLPLILTKGNYGNAKDPDSHSQMRYVEVKLSEFAWDCFFSEWDLKSDLVDMKPSFNGKDMEPIYLPAKYPVFLMSWGSGIGYGSSTKSPAFLPQEAMQAVITLIEDKNAKLVLYPEDPLGCTILDKKVFKKFVDYNMNKKESKNLTFRVRSDYEINKDSIVVLNTPYEVNPITVINRITDLVEKGKLDGIVDIETNLKAGSIHQLGNKSDTAEIWIEYKKGYDPHILMEKLYKVTDLETTFSLNCVYVNMNKNVKYNLRESILTWIDIRRKILKRMHRIELTDGAKRVYVLDALIHLFESNSIDAVINIIKKNKRSDVIELLIKKFKISDYQARQITDMRIRDLSQDSYQDYVKEKIKIEKRIDELQNILKKKKYIDNIIISQMKEGMVKYNRKRTSKVIDLKDKSIEESKNTICITDTTFIKKLPNKSEDLGLIADDSKVVFLNHNASSLDKLFMFTQQGRTYSEFIGKISESNLDGVGMYLRRKVKNDDINIVTAVTGSIPSKSTLIFVTKKGMIKQTNFESYFVTSQNSVAIKLVGDDKLADVYKANNNKGKILVYTLKGYCVLFDSIDVTVTSRTTVGVTAIKLEEGDEVCGIVRVKESDTHIVTISEKGEFRRFSLEASLNSMKRGSSGVSIVSKSETLDKVISVGPKNTSIEIITDKFIENIEIENIPIRTRLSKGDKLLSTGRGNNIIRVIPK